MRCLRLGETVFVPSLAGGGSRRAVDALIVDAVSSVDFSRTTLLLIAIRSSLRILLELARVVLDSDPNNYHTPGELMVDSYGFCRHTVPDERNNCADAHIDRFRTLRPVRPLNSFEN